MPRLNAAAWIIWTALIAVQVNLLAIMIHKSQWKRWPALFSFLVLRNITSFSLLYIMLFVHRPLAYVLYFYFYWTAETISMAIRVWMIIEFGCAACQAARKVQALLWRIVPTIAVLFLGISFLVTANGTVVYRIAIIQTTLNFGRALALTWLATFLVMAYACEFFGLKWSEVDRKLAIGFSVQAVGITVTSWWIGLVSRGHITTVSNVQDGLYFASLLIWGFALLWDREDDSLPDLEHLLRISDPYLKSGQMLRRKIN